VTLLCCFPAATGVAVDVSAPALAVAEANAHRHGVAGRARFLRSDWFSAVDGTFDLIVSNPPYIQRGALAALPRDVRDGDPAVALDGGLDGLEAYRAIARGALEHLGEAGSVLVEIGAGQAVDVTDIFAAAGMAVASVPPRPVRDLGGIERVLVFKRR
jgi:release factor glutamine methyltransferase